jgi:hypothetical protein
MVTHPPILVPQVAAGAAGETLALPDSYLVAAGARAGGFAPAGDGAQVAMVPDAEVFAGSVAAVSDVTQLGDSDEVTGLPPGGVYRVALRPPADRDPPR